jgi:tetratricopeptide (TPR) repeat protein
VSPRARVVLTVAVAGAVAVAATLALGAITRPSEGGSRATQAAPACPRRLPLQLDLGVRQDAEAVALRRAQGAYARGEIAVAERLFRRYDSVSARVGEAVASWPRGTVVTLRRLAEEHPRSGVVRLHLGLALACSGRTRAAEAQWRAAERVDPDSSVAIAAEDLLHPPPEFARGLPTFVPNFRPPSVIASLPPERQLVVLARRARGRNVRAKLLYGVALQRLGRPVSAEHVYAAAARLAPDDPEARVAMAVGLFDKDAPARAFARLGPLTKRFPRAATVRFHLGLLLLWLGQVDEGERQLVLARALAPASIVGREASSYLVRLGGNGTT